MWCHRVCIWLKGEDIGAQSNITQRNSLEEVRRIIIHNGAKSSMNQDVTHFERAQTYPRRNSRVRCRRRNVGTPKNNFSYLQHLHNSTSLEEKLLAGCLRPPSTCHHMQNKSRRRNEDNARLLAQMPASRVPRKPGGNNRQERKDAVSHRKDGNRGAGNTLARQQDRTKRRSSAFGRRPQCVVEHHEKLRQPSRDNLRHPANGKSGVGTDNMQLSSPSRRYIHEGKTAKVVTVSLSSL